MTARSQLSDRERRCAFSGIACDLTNFQSKQRSHTVIALCLSDLEIVCLTLTPLHQIVITRDLILAQFNRAYGGGCQDQLTRDMCEANRTPYCSARVES